MSRRMTDDRQFLPFEGLLSGLLTCALPPLLGSIGGDVLLFVGAVFGAVISAHFWLFRGLRSGWRVFGFVATSTAAYTIAFYSTAWTPIRIAALNFTGTGSGDIDSSQFLTGGFVGGAIVFVGFFFFLSPAGEVSRFLVKAFCFSLIAALLGVFGWVAGDILGKIPGFGPRYNQNFNYYALYVIWQTGVAMLFVFLLPAQESSVVRPAIAPPRNRESGEPAKSLPLAAKLFMASVAIVLGFFIVSQIRAERSAHRLQAQESAAQARRIVERPSTENLPAIEPLPVEQVLVLNPIAGHPGSLINQGTPGQSVTVDGAGSTVPSVFYSVIYKRSQWATSDEEPVASVAVTLFPNSDWARYETKQVPDWNLAATNPQDVTTVTKFENKILMNTIMRYPDGTGNLYFYWVSGNRFVLVRFFGPEDDEFLAEYLKLHPSTL
jgi:hypothetical protein